MRGAKLISIVVNNYNYAHFVGRAIASAISQNSTLTEVIVVDDGSTDESRDVIDQFANQVSIIYQQNGGQASCLTTGFKRATGKCIVFLDADDVLLEGASEQLAALAEAGIAKITWSMPIIGPDDVRLPATVPARAPAWGDLRQILIDRGPLSFECAPCSGNAWSRDFLESVLPIPETPFRRGADGYLLQLSPIYGRTLLSPKPLSAYRRHGANYLAAKSEFEIRDLLRRRYPALADAVAKHLALRHVPFDRNGWRHEHWDRLDELEATILQYVEVDRSFVLIDDDTLNVGDRFHGRTRRTLMEHRGKYAGPPVSGRQAVEQLSSFVLQGACYVVVVWYSFWWLESYPDLSSYLDEKAITIYRSDTSIIYRLTEAVK